MVGSASWQMHQDFLRGREFGKRCDDDDDDDDGNPETGSVCANLELS